MKKNMSTPLAELIRTAFEAAHATGARNVDAYVVGWLSAEAHIHHELDRLRRPPIPAPVVLPAIERNTSTPESREFWESAEKTAEEIKDWPASRRAGINVAQQRETPRPLRSDRAYAPDHEAEYARRKS